MPAWTGIIDPSRAIDWSSVGVPGGIPTNATQCGATLPSSSTISDVNAAIQACTGASASAPKFVKLGSGQFSFSASLRLNKNYVILRGSGPMNTIIKMTGTGGCGVFSGDAFCVGSAGGGDFLGNPNCTNNVPPCTHSWATTWLGTSTGGVGTYTQGDTRLIVGSTANMAVGRIIVLDQLDDTVDDGGVCNSSQLGIFSTEGLPNFGRIMGSDGNLNRTQHQLVRVTNIVDATHVDVTPGIYMPNWRSSRSPGVCSWGTLDSHYSFGNAVEDLTIDNSLIQPEFGNSIIAIEYCYGCWVKNVRTLYGPRNHINFIQSAHGEVRDSYLYGNQGSGAVSYGIECAGASDILLINNIYHKLDAAELSPCVGSVSAYNYSFGGYHIGGGNCVDQGGGVSSCNWATHWGTHDSGGGMRLYEGNQNNGFLTDPPHGNSPLYTFFRNAWSGIDDQDIKSGGYRRAILLSAFSRGYNVVGNILGTTRATFTYELQSADGNDDLNIYNLGQGNGLSGGHDNFVTTSLLRWGNYDSATSTTRWLASEVPSGTPIRSLNSNPVPSNTNLPNSFFLSGQPAWWNTPWGPPPWPPIGPDINGGPGLAGHVYDIPAKLCFNNIGLDNTPAYSSSAPRIKAFDAAICYIGSSAPPVPINKVVADSIDEVVF